MRKILGFGLSLVVTLAGAWAGLHYDKALLYGAVLLFGLIVVLWLWSWAHPTAPQSAAEAREAERTADRERKRALIDKGRDFAAIYTKRGDDGGFYQYLAGTKTFAALRPHLSDEFKDKLTAPRTIYLGDGSGGYHPLVKMFLDEMDRLEREWG